MNIMNACRFIARIQLNSAKIISLSGSVSILNNNDVTRHRFFHHSNDTRLIRDQISGKSLNKFATHDRSLLSAHVCIANTQLTSVRHGAHKPPLTQDFVRERILLVLRLYDKVDPEKLTLESHFYNDLGLDSLDHVEVIMAMEDEFGFEIPDVDAERLLTPGDILTYIINKEEVYKELEHHDDSHGHH